MVAIDSSDEVRYSVSVPQSNQNRVVAKHDSMTARDSGRGPTIPSLMTRMNNYTVITKNNTMIDNANNSGSSSESSWVMMSRSAPPPTLQDIANAFSERNAQDDGRRRAETSNNIMDDDGIRVRGEDADDDEEENVNPFCGISDNIYEHMGTSGADIVATAELSPPPPATATVMETVQDLSDDVVARKLLEEELLMSGRTLEEYLEEARRVEREASVARIPSPLVEETNEEDDRKPAAVPQREPTSLFSPPVAAMLDEQQATVVDITEHDLHPCDFGSDDVHAELIGEDYSVAVASQAAAISTATAEPTVGAVQVEDGAAEEATVLDSKPAAQSTPSDWTERPDEEARVLETTNPPSQSWDEPGDTSEVTVDGVVEEEASVVDITEQFVHPADTDEHEAQATLIGEDHSRSVPLSMTPSGIHPDPLDQNHRTSSAPAMGDSSLSADQIWMNHPFGLSGDENEVFVMPPPSSPGVAVPTMEGDTLHVSTPLAPIERIDSGEDEQGDRPTPIPPIPAAARSTPRRETSNTSSRSQDSLRSDEGVARRETSSGGDSNGSQRSGLGALSAMASRSTSNVMEKLFGDGRRQIEGADNEAMTESILPRTLLPWSIFYNESTNMWVATINTNQKALDSDNVEAASKALRAFSLQTEAQARALAVAWTPPRMLAFEKNPKCFICKAKFAVFKRACHCRNCGVCICSNCTTQWPAKSVPETYNIKRESMVNICKSCHWLSNAFRVALLDGNHDQAVALHATGNVNIVTPFPPAFPGMKGELYYPSHCAVLGGNLDLLKWLVEEPNCCPLRSIRISGRKGESKVVPVVTSKGRSLLMLAMEKNHVDIIRYLVVDKNMPLSEEKSLTMATALAALDAVLRLLPAHEPVSQSQVGNADGTDSAAEATLIREEVVDASAPSLPPETLVYTMPQSMEPDSNQTWDCSSNGQAGDHDIAAMYEFAAEDSMTAGTVSDACIICFANPIDCVIMPCGHQICCMQCGDNISPRKCPVCSVDCSFVRVYKP